MQLLYQFFYRLYGIRRVQNMLSPKMTVLPSFSRDSMLHYLTHDPEHPELDTSKLYFGAHTRRILVDYPEELTDKPKGTPRKKPVILRTLLRPFHIKNKKFRYLPKHFEVQSDEMSLFVENYNYLYQVYRYAQLPMTPYYQWWDIQRSMWDHVASIAQKTSKQHFFVINVPEELPSFNFLRMYSSRLNVSVLKIFDTPEKLFVLELFKWISSEARDETIFGALKPEHWAKVNLVFTIKDGRSTVLNLGYLSSWVEKSENLTEFINVTQFSAVQIQKLFLKFLMSAASGALQNAESTDEVQASGLSTIPDIDMDDADGEGSDYNDTPVAASALRLLDPQRSGEKVTAAPEVSGNKDTASQALSEDERLELDAQLKDIDEDLKTLEAMTVKRLEDKGVHVDKDGNMHEEVILKEEVPLETIHSKIYDDASTELTLRGQVEQYADYGLLSASDYKRFVRDIDEYKKLPDPYGSGTPLVQAMEITPQMILLDPVKTQIEASEMVLDKSMLHSTLQCFNHDYIDKVLPKDILSMTSSLQRAGVVIRKHDIEIDHSAMGSYENHTLELRPIDGQPSTVRFRIPKVETDGTFTAGGSKYQLRHQRVDAPIRKINPTAVALTSYYGKTFVALNPRKSNSSLDWIVKKMNEASMTEHAYIKRVGPAKVFDNNFEAPYIYNALADHFKTITTTKFTLTFDHTERTKLVNEIQLQKLETNGSRVVGVTAQRKPIIVNKDNHFFSVNDEGALDSLGDVYDVLGLDVQSAPVDFTEVRIFSKTVPVAIILGYSIGFKNLVRLLGAKYRVTQGRQSKSLQAHEYAVSFKDESYIFSRKQRVASMILAGFLEYDKQLRQYLVEDFNHKDIYLNLLQTKGLSSIYIREIEATQQLFVDPITKEILQQLGEPTTFNGLLIRSTELLQTYHHPDTQDMDAMRIRGYERLSGVIYKELSSAIRQYRNRNIAGKSKIDISPYQIWSTIMKDPAIKLVEDINPIQNLKESEIVTYVGEGGRSKDSLSKPSRAYHPNDMGIVSEATVDSSDVGINAYLSASPNFKDMRGMPMKRGKITPTQLISTSALLAPGADRDDPKRVNTLPPVSVMRLRQLP